MKRVMRSICIVLIFAILVHPVVYASENVDTRASHFFRGILHTLIKSPQDNLRSGSV